MARYRTKLKLNQKPKRNWLPLWIALIGLGLVLIAGWEFLGNGQLKANIEVKGSPRLQVEKNQIDHGNVKLGNSIIDTVRITNIGDQPLRFTEAPYVEVKEGC